MMLNLIDKLGDWNPQLLRELKGRLKLFPVAIALVTSVATQLIIFLYQLRELPSKYYSSYGKYCNLKDLEKFNKTLEFCPSNQIDMQLWWRDHWEYMFLSLSVIFIFTLLVAGTYLIVNDLAQEERSGTLNFIRLSPQSETSIFTGKLLGVPVLIYLVVIAAIPLHILTGKLANIALSYILFFYLTLVANCIFFYSIALLFGVFGGRAFSGFKPWLASGLVMLFLMMTISMSHSNIHYSYAWLTIFSPISMTDYLFPNLFNRYYDPILHDLQFFNLPLGESSVSLLTLHLLNYTLGTYWAWQGLKRCFRNPNATIFSKQQSYLIVANFEIMLFGFFISENYSSSRNLFYGIQVLYLWNILLFVGLLAVVLPHRQAIQDWARFRYQKVANSENYRKNYLLSELMVGEKTPATLAIAINLFIAASGFFVLILNAKINNFDNTYQTLGFAGILLFISSTIIYGSIAQIMLMLKNSKRALWAAGATGVTIIIPTLILSILNISASNRDYLASLLWLFTSGFWYGVKNSTVSTILTVFLCQLMIAALLNWYLIKQVKSAGESATKALFSQSNVKI